jgi:general L-amino acid transport system permease protein
MGVAAPAGRPPLWRNVRFLRVAGQVAFVLAVALVLREMFLNLEFGVRRLNIDLSFDFLGTQAGFGIKEGIAYSAGRSTSRAFFVGFMNTVRVAGVGILLASILGLVMGVARLSPNWLLRKLAQVYVEAIRNTPVLIQIIFWGGILLALPVIGAGGLFGDTVFISNKGAAIPWPRVREDAGGWMWFVLAGLIAAWVVRRWRTRVNDRTGVPSRRFLWAAAVFVLIAGTGYVILGEPIEIDVPEQVGLQYEGGVQISRHYFAVLVALVVYTGAFIAEIIRGSILAVSRGQKEAAEALGLTPFQQLRYVVLPQALRIAIPPINSQYLNLTKNSSLAVAVGFPDMVSIGNTIVNQKGRAFQVYAMIMLAYLSLTLGISLVMNVLNYLVTRRGALR